MNDNGEWETETKWFTVTLWGEKAERYVERCTKGRPVVIQGALKADPNTGGPVAFSKKDSSPGAKFELIHSELNFPNSRRMECQMRPIRMV